MVNLNAQGEGRLIMSVRSVSEELGHSCKERNRGKIDTAHWCVRRVIYIRFVFVFCVCVPVHFMSDSLEARSTTFTRALEGK